jgi:putative transposase
MPQHRYSKLQINSILREYENGLLIPALIKKYGVSQATIYNWVTKYGKMHNSKIQKISELEEENDRLKRMFADLSIENQIIKSRLPKIGDKS